MTQSKQQISALLYQISLHLHPCWRKTGAKINLFADVKHFTIMHNLITFNIKFQQRKKGVVLHREGQKQSNSSWTSYHTALWRLFIWVCETPPVKYIICITSRSGPVCNSNRFQNSWWDASFNNAAKSTTTWMIMFLFCPKGCVLGRRHKAWHHWQSPHFWKLHSG